MDEALTLAMCWRIERRDGVTIGLTDHDRDLTIDGLVHRAAPGMVPSAIVRTDGLDPDAMEVTGALNDAAIDEDDLVAGRWDGARVIVFAIDWARGGGRIDLSEGTLGAVETVDGGFSAELRGAAAALDRAVVEETSAHCRAELGDRRCRVAMAPRRRFARVLAADGETLTLDHGEPGADAYGGGRLRWLGGENAGLEGAIARSEGGAIVLRLPPAFVATPGTLVELIEGCDKMLATCAARFGNAVNFRGEPYLPGLDLLTRYPGG